MKSFISIYLVHISLAEVMKFTGAEVETVVFEFEHLKTRKRECREQKWHGEDYSVVR